MPGKLLARPILRGTIALTLAGLYARVAGSLYRILLVRVVGDAGIGLFQMSLPLYSLATHLATLGLPGALAKVVAEGSARGDWPAVARVWRIATGLVLAASLLTALAAWAASDLLAHRVLTDPRTALALLIMPVAVVASSLASVLRGYFQGLAELVPGAAAQVVEQTVRIVTVLGLAMWLLPYGLPAAAGGAMAGIALGEAAALICLWVFYRRQEGRVRPWPLPSRQRQAPADPVAAAGLLRLSSPLMAGGLIASLTATADVLLIPRRLLEAGHTWEDATRLYGQLTGMAMPVLFLPMVVLYPLLTLVVPAVASAAALGNRAALAQRIRLSCRLTLAVGLAASALFLSVPRPLALFLYGSDEIAPLVSLLALAAPITFLQNTEAAVLTGLGLTGWELRNYLAGVALRLAAIYTLTAIPSLGIRGALWGIILGQATMLLLHARDIRRATGVMPLP